LLARLCRPVFVGPQQKALKKAGFKQALPLKGWAIRHLPDNQLPYRI